MDTSTSIITRGSGNDVRIKDVSVKRNLLLMFGSVVFSVFLLEVLLRLVGVEYKTFVISDPDLGWSLRPGGQGWYRSEGRAYVQINRYGFRGPAPSLAKPADTYRIAVLGDSFTVALDVSDEAMMTSVFARTLRGCGKYAGKKVEVLNFGVGGHGTAQELIMLRKRALEFKPDMVVLMVFAGNDVFDNSRAFRESLVDEAPYFVRTSEGKLLLDDSFRRTQKLGLLNVAGTILYHSRLLQVLNQVRKGFGVRSALKGGVQRVPTNDPAKAGELEVAWQVTDGLLGMIQEECRRNGVALVIGVIPFGSEITPAAELASDQRNFDYDYRIGKIAGKWKIPTILLAGPMAQYAVEKKEFLNGFPSTAPGFGHWNETGNRVAGELMGGFVCSLPPGLAAAN